MAVIRTLSVVDYVLLVLLLLSSAAIGILFGFFKSKKNSAKEFLLANGSMGLFPTALSIMVSFLSAITLLGTPSEIYMHGTMYGYQTISWIIASIVAALVFMPKFREMGFTSVYELIYMAIVLYGPALALSQTTGLNIWIAVVSIGSICTFYSSVGGMKAVIWTDVLQSVVILVGLLAVVIQGLITLGGFKRVWFIASQGGRIEFDNISFDPRTRHTIWSVLIGGSMNTLATYGFNQAQIQRYMSIRSTSAAKNALFINAVGSGLLIALSSFIGVIIYAYYADCDPYTDKKIKDIDQILPYFVMDVLGDKKGLPGIFLACIFSGSLSTISSGLNSLAAVIVEDVYKRLLGRHMTDQRQGFISKIISVILGIVIMLLTYVVSYFDSILNATLSIFGVLEGPIMGIFVLGFFFPRVNRRGGLIGFAISLAFLLWIFLGAQITKKQMKNVSLSLSIDNCSDAINNTLTNWTTTIFTSLKRDPLIDLYSVSYMWYTPIAVGTVIIVGNIVSYLTHPLSPHEIDPKLIISVRNVCCCCLPKQWCQWLQFGIDYEAYHKEQNENSDTHRNDHVNSSHEILQSNKIVPAPIIIDGVANDKQFAN
ncbi:unnamed protein product [Rotaria magnacalcarata]|uniref:Sodium-coupled monocarboxylate transporter 1 n=3 Tax=Rotaria magnacalcarata TaxID=392030 RepID=A0A8S2KE80_9BILA|nr:unnamed protein product [Rotaria magnacalcarata]CAF3851954.1 unnamed protein product [Rotaria magnacalcarata]CAF3879550.1 unnamed protein product [Rotaria magnacalcarata]